MQSLIRIILCISVLILTFLSFSMLYADNSNLIAHYTFDEGQGTVLKDSSVNGLDGKIINAEYVKSPHGYALKFVPAKQSYVDLGTSPLFNIQGDMSFTAWIKVDTKDLGDKYIFGDSASLAKDRNFYISANNLLIRLEHGNESAVEQLNSNEAVFNGEWQHMAVICENPNYYLYVNGKQVKFGTMTVPITASPISSHRIGGWWWEKGFFNGEIDDIKLYARAISEKEILADYGQAQETANTDIQKVEVIVHYPLHKVQIKTLCKNIDAANQKLKISVYAPNGKIIKSVINNISETRTGSERAVVETWLDAKQFTPGNYKTDVSIIDSKNKNIVNAEAVTLNYPKKPEWFNSKEGTSDKVLAPFTPIEVKQNNGNSEINTWGRSYVVGNSPVFSDIISFGKSLLEGPVEVTCNIESSDFSSIPTQKTKIKSNQSKTYIFQQFNTQNKKAKLEVRTDVDYDGFAKVDFKLVAAMDTQINQLRISFPLNGEYAKLFYSWFSNSVASNNGALNGADRAFGFRPIIWIGDEEKGVSWMAESDQNWNPADINKAIEVKHQNGKVYLILNIVEKPIKLKKNKPITYTFALQATPVKPITKDLWDFRFHHISQGSIGPREIIFDFPDETFDKVAALGAKTAIIHEHWTPYQGYSKTNDEAGLRKFVEQWHKRKMQLLLYFGFNVSDLMPEWPYIGEDVVMHPKSGYIPFNYPPQPPQNAYVGCFNSVYQDLVVDGIAKLVDNFDIDGVYLDTTTVPFACTNRYHGCGYIAPDGTLKATYPVFAVRNLLKRMYQVIKERKPDGQIDAHVYDAMNIAALSWATSYLNGEQLTQVPKDPYYPNMLSLSRFRTEFMGYNWGIPADMLYYGLGDYKKANALTLLHEVPVRSSGIEMGATQSSLWKLMDAYDRKGSKWFPYWKNSDYVAITPADCYVSFRLHPKNGILAFVSNLSKETQTISIKFDIAKLSYTLGTNTQLNPSTAIDALTNESIAYSNGSISLELPTIGWKAIWIR